MQALALCQALRTKINQDGSLPKDHFANRQDSIRTVLARAITEASSVPVADFSTAAREQRRDNTLNIVSEWTAARPVILDLMAELRTVANSPEGQVMRDVNGDPVNTPILVADFPVTFEPALDAAIAIIS